jgi:hypothetical protein
MIGNVAGFFTQTAMIYRANESQNAIGAMVNTPTSYAEIAGRLRAMAAGRTMAERVSANKMTQYQAFRFYTDSTAVLATDELLIDGVRYRVTFADNVMAMNRLWQIDLELVGHDSS